MGICGQSKDISKIDPEVKALKDKNKSLKYIKSNLMNSIKKLESEIKINKSNQPEQSINRKNFNDQLSNAQFNNNQKFFKINTKINPNFNNNPMISFPSFMLPINSQISYKFKYTTGIETHIQVNDSTTVGEVITQLCDQLNLSKEKKLTLCFDGNHQKYDCNTSIIFKTLQINPNSGILVISPDI